MAKVRAYKIAEELGIERSEFVEKAKELGIELKSAMASLDDEQVELVREKLGAKAARSDRSQESRVLAKSGAVIRRRRKPEAEAPPEPEVVEPQAAESEPELEAVAGEPVTEPQVAEPGEEAAPEPEAPTTPAPAPEPVRPAAGTGEGARPARPAADRNQPPDRKGKKKQQFKEVVNLREQEQIARQVTGRTGQRHAPFNADPRTYASPRKRRRDQAPAKPPAAQPAAAKAQVVRLEGTISVAELAKQLGAKAAQIQGKLMGLGTMVSLNQALDVETATQVAKDYGFEIQDVGFQESEFIEEEPAANAEGREPRPPVVTVMGHVDHGKTSLLDAIRKANVVEGEAGGITQHIGAYQARLDDGKVLSFIDTPGHAAFTSMRARGAQATDVVILVVAASDGIMPQTIEAIDHAKAAGVPIVVAINKCDLPDANPDQTRQRLMEHGLVVEDFGGDVLAINVSATQKTGLDKLLEAVSLQAELLELKGDPSAHARGVVLEAQLDKGRGPVATILVQDGTLKRGDSVVVGTQLGRVRSMQDEHGAVLKEAGPSRPVQLIGLSGVPGAGEILNAVQNERAAKQIVEHRKDEARRIPRATRPRVSLEDLFRDEADGPAQLNIVLKSDVDGSAEAIREALGKIESDKVDLKVIHAGVGAITEGDIQFAEASTAIVIGFHVRPDNAARKAAEKAGVDIRIYQVIYELLDEVRAAMAGLLAPTFKEKFLGRAEVRETFTIPKIGMIAGSYVTEGQLKRGAGCRLVRDGVQVYEGKFGSLRRFKDDVREVQSGFECGIGIEGFNDLKIGDVIEAFELEEQPAEL